MFWFTVATPHADKKQNQTYPQMKQSKATGSRVSWSRCSGLASAVRSWRVRKLADSSAGSLYVLSRVGEDGGRL